MRHRSLCGHYRTLARRLRAHEPGPGAACRGVLANPALGRAVRGVELASSCVRAANVHARADVWAELGGGRRFGRSAVERHRKQQHHQCHRPPRRACPRASLLRHPERRFHAPGEGFDPCKKRKMSSTGRALIDRLAKAIRGPEPGAQVFEPLHLTRILGPPPDVYLHSLLSFFVFL